MNPLNGYQTYIVGFGGLIIGIATFTINIAAPDAHFPIDNQTASIIIMSSLGFLGLRNAVSKLQGPKS